jgi:hypothetical protein
LNFTLGPNRHPVIIMDDTNAPSTETCSSETCNKSRCCWIRATLLVVLLIGIVSVAISWRRGHDDVAGPPLLKANAKDLKATVITPSVDAKIEPGKNVLWCSTFQLVWNEGCRYAGGDIHLKDEPPVVAALNRKLGDERDVDADSCLVMCGLVQDGVVKKIQQELQRKFQGQADPDLLNSIERELPPDGWVGYAYLFRALPFKYPFRRLKEPLSFGSAQVMSFGLRNATCRMDDVHKAAQVIVLDYVDSDDFVLELKPKNNSERIVLAKIPPAKTLQETIEAVRSRIASTTLSEWKKNFDSGGSIVVPVLNFDLLQTYDDLYGKPITTTGPLQGMPTVLAMQTIRFRLDERGAILKSEAAVAKCAEGPEPTRQFIFDKPFLILLERKDAAQPYFALWVDNPELLVPFK